MPGSAIGLQDFAPGDGRIRSVGLLLPAGRRCAVASALAADLAHGREAGLLVAQPEPARSQASGLGRLLPGPLRNWRPAWQPNPAEASDHHVSEGQQPDLIVAPAGFDLRGRSATFDDELALWIARRQRLSVVRVARRPLTVPSILVIVRTAAEIDRLQSPLLPTHLWPGASVVVLPIGGEGAREGAERRAAILARAGVVVRLAPLLDDAFELADIDPYRSFAVVAISISIPRVGYMARACHDPAAVLGATCALTILTR